MTHAISIHISLAEGSPMALWVLRRQFSCMAGGEGTGYSTEWIAILSSIVELPTCNQELRYSFSKDDGLEPVQSPLLSKSRVSNWDPIVFLRCLLVWRSMKKQISRKQTGEERQVSSTYQVYHYGEDTGLYHSKFSWEEKRHSIDLKQVYGPRRNCLWHFLPCFDETLCFM